MKLMHKSHIDNSLFPHSRNLCKLRIYHFLKVYVYCLCGTTIMIKKKINLCKIIILEVYGAFISCQHSWLA